jgi:predicted AlkP superfamily pyrophosphatase or phosphodiesterase
MKFTGVAAFLGLAFAAVPAIAAPPPKPKLIVAISIDQFAAGLFEQYRAGYTGGLRTLANGVAYASGYQSHSGTETCPGHSTILSGRHPSSTGIAANGWYDVKTGSNVYCVGIAGTSDPDARGPAYLRVPTFGEWLKQQQPPARVIAVSGKDRAAIMMAGHNPDAVYWWKDGTGFITSRYAGPVTPIVTKVAQAFNAVTFGAWSKAAPVLWPAASPACAAMEKPYRFGKVDVPGTIPAKVDPPTSDAFQDELRISPAYDRLALDFASKLIDQRKLGRGRATDLLAVSLSATDYVGHRYGNGGAEMCVQMAALDASLGRFLDKITSLKIPVVVVLTADHGAMDAAERAADHGVNAHRISGKKLFDGLNAAMQAQFSLNYEPFAGDIDQIVVNIPGDDADFRAKLTAAAVAWLKAQADVAVVFTANEVAAAKPAPDTSPDKLTLIERFYESYVPGRSGDIMIALTQGTYPSIPVSADSAVAGHGSPWDYDRRVPILFWWPGVTPDDRKTPIETVDIAPTLAGIANVKAPPVDGKCLDLTETGNCPK